GPNRAHNIGLLTKLIEDEEFDELPAVARHALRNLVEQLSQVKTKLIQIGRDLMSVVKRSKACQRLMTIPGVGAITFFTNSCTVAGEQPVLGVLNIATTHRD